VCTIAERSSRRASAGGAADDFSPVASRHLAEQPQPTLIADMLGAFGEQAVPHRDGVFVEIQGGTNKCDIGFGTARARTDLDKTERAAFAGGRIEDDGIGADATQRPIRAESGLERGVWPQHGTLDVERDAARLQLFDRD
jgi:hypothetical protein